MVEKGQFEEQVAGLVRRLPPMPDSVSTLIGAAQTPGAEEQVVTLIKQDPGLCVDLLHLANAFGETSETRIDTIERAVQEVGVAALVDLITVWYANNSLRAECAEMLYLDEYFLHSQDISKGCRILSEVCGMDRQQQDIYAVAGLIHDIGRLVILLTAGKTTTHFMGTPPHQMARIVQDERQALGLDHCKVGKQICLQWDFSGFMQDMVLRHHSPLIGDDFNMPGAIVFTAHFITCSDFTGDILSTLMPGELCKQMDITIDDLYTARDRFTEQTDTQV